MAASEALVGRRGSLGVPQALGEGSRSAATGVIVALALIALGCSAPDPVVGPRPSEVAVTPQERDIPPDRDVIAATVTESVHAELDCSDCHVPGPGQILPEGKVAASRCTQCHDEEGAAFARSVHGSVANQDNRVAPTCATCHGDHDIFPADDPRSFVSKRRLPEACGRCHQNSAVAAALGIRDPLAAQHYLDSIHGRALVAKGLLAAPSCVDCHGAEHDILAKNEPRSTVSRARVADTCGQCHAGVAEAFAKGVHAERLRDDDGSAPVCTSCHSAHEIEAPTGQFRLEADAMCGKCHAARLEGYLFTYHGRAHHLGSAKVAACHDCHGQHDIRRIADPASTMSVERRVETCRECHPGAPANFVSFSAHANHLDREHYPLLFWAFVVMTSLIVGTFAVWGLHTLLWMLRTFVHYLRDPRAFRAEKRHVRTEQAGKVYVRFLPIDRFTHLLVIVSFVLLVATGMPLKFHQTAWARAVFDLLGGPAVAAGIHRFGAILSGLYLLIHVSTMVSRVMRKAALFHDTEGRFRLRRLLGHVFGPDSPLPNLDDLRDVRSHLAWFVGRGPRPRFDRFTYWEKFDYFAELWGSAFIGVSGLVMWFPGAFATVFPGWIVNLAQVVHSQEALLAAGFILTFHFFNSHFRLEKFPMDTVIFSGRITEAELQHERGRQYDRLVAEGRLEELKVADEWVSWRWLFQSFGTVAVVTGGLLAIGIFYAILRYGLR